MTHPLTALALRVEQATAEQQRDLIIEAIDVVGGSDQESWLARQGAFLDAAILLVPEHIERTVAYISKGGSTRIQLYYERAMRYCSGDAATPALALTAACLRAIAAKEKGK